MVEPLYLRDKNVTHRVNNVAAYADMLHMDQ